MEPVNPGKSDTVTDFNYQYDYTGFDAATRSFLQTQVRELRSEVRLLSRMVIKIGKRLITIKGRLPHGQFLPWLTAEFGWSERTAQRYMKIAECYGSYADGLGQIPDKISLNALLMLVGDDVPEAVRVSVIVRAETGEAITAKQAGKAVTDWYHGLDESTSPDLDDSPRLAGEGPGGEGDYERQYNPKRDGAVLCPACGSITASWVEAPGDMWVCVCGHRLADDVMTPYEPASKTVERAHNSKVQRQARQSKAAADAKELADLREEKAQWGIERAKLQTENAELRAENARLKARLVLGGAVVEQPSDQPAAIHIQ